MILTQEILGLWIYIPVMALMIAGIWRLFQKAGKPGWAAIVPVYGTMVWIDIVKRPKWWIILYFIPVINVIMFLGLLVDIMKKFGRYSYIDRILVVLVPFIYLPYIAFKKDTVFVGDESKSFKPKKNVFMEWADAITFAIIAASIIRWLYISAYTIPTSSMEGSLLVGDFLFVSKMHYGPRSVKTPLRVPLTDNKIWGTNISSYIPFPQLPYGRLSFPPFGWTDVKNNDVVVFNWPADTAGHPIDLKTSYIKRCVGIAGDKIEIKERQLFVNDKKAKNPPNLQFTYHVFTKENLREKVFEKFKINLQEIARIDENGYRILMSPSTAEKFKSLEVVKEVVPVTVPKGQTDPHNKAYGYPLYHWNQDNFGPLIIPKSGMTIPISEKNIVLYGKVIKDYEWNSNVEIDKKNNTIRINGEKIKKYTFKQNYYFMMGDNRHNSLDSRFWGFVPRDHIVGKAWFVWMSVDWAKGIFGGGLRWDRIFKPIW